MRLVDLEGLGHVDVVPHLDPLTHAITHHLLLLLVSDLAVLLQRQDRVLLLEDGVCGRVEAVERVFFERSAVGALHACSLNEGRLTVLLIFFLLAGALCCGS